MLVLKGSALEGRWSRQFSAPMVLGIGVTCRDGDRDGDGDRDRVAVPAQPRGDAAWVTW